MATSINPSTEEDLRTYSVASVGDVELAIASARKAFPAWEETPPLTRGKLMRKAADIIRSHALELALVDAADCGNPVNAMQMDAEIAATQLEYFAGLVLENKGETIPTGNESLNYTLREPLGVVARIFPFNHPFMFAAGKMAAPLAAGNTVLLVGSILAWLQTLRALEFEPRTLHTAQQIASLVNLSRAALVHSDSIARVSLVKTMADEEKVRIAPREPGDKFRLYDADSLSRTVSAQLSARACKATTRTMAKMGLSLVCCMNR